jgi:phage terminase large subunit-like protein
LLNEIVVSASRTPERVESPVTIERMGIADIKSQRRYFYDGLENMKEVQMNTSSLSLSQSTPVVLQQWQIRFMHWLMGWTTSY